MGVLRKGWGGLRCVWGTEGTWGVFRPPEAPPPAGALPLGWTRAPLEIPCGILRRILWEPGSPYRHCRGCLEALWGFLGSPLPLQVVWEGSMDPTEPLSAAVEIWGPYGA